MVDEIAKRRFEKADNAGDSTVEGALNACLAEHKKEKFSSVYILAIPEDTNRKEASFAYVAGHEFATYQQVWIRLQNELLWLMQAMCRS